MSKEEDIAAAEAALAAAKAEPEDPKPEVTPEPEVVAPVVAPVVDTKWLEAKERLNKAKPYGTCMPIDGSRRYFQDGKYFDYAGELTD